MFYIDYNGHTNHEYGMAVTTRPSIPAPVPRGEYVQIAGRDGSLLVTDGTYENITISVPMNFARPPVKLGESFRSAKNWIKGGGTLKMSDDFDVFYKVKAAALTKASRKGKLGMEFLADFVCDPYTYMDSGLVPIQPGNIYNPFDVSHPVYTILGEGMCTLTVNGNSITANVGQNLTIDTDLFLAYRQDGTLQNSAVTGDYDLLWLQEGENTVTVNSGFSCSIVPNWRTL